MAVVLPFADRQAFVYNPARPGLDLSRLVAPPYDVVPHNPAMAAQLRTDPYNITHLTLPSGGDAADSKYGNAGRLLEDWVDSEVLAPIPGCMLLYRQGFDFRGERHSRTAIMALVGLEEYGRRVIVPHEGTLQRDKDDRFELMKATNGANLEPVFLLYKPSTDISLVVGRKRGDPFMDATFPYDGSRHSFWLLDTGECRVITNALKDAKLLIADGHNRYETGLKYKGVVGGLGSQHIMAGLVSIGDPGLMILPTYRVLDDAAAHAVNSVRGWGVIGEYFDIEYVSRQDFSNRLARKSEDDAVGLVIDGGSCVLTPNWEMQQLTGNISFGRDVASIDWLLATMGVREGISYQGASGIEDVVDRQAVFVFNRISAGALFSGFVDSGGGEDAGEKPAKLTYFSPKLISGAVVRAPNHARKAA